MDAQSIARAVQTLRDALGTQIGGEQQAGMVHMRQVLEEKLGISENEADATVKMLAQTRQILYHPNAGTTDSGVPLPGLPLGLPVVGMGTGAGNIGAAGVALPAAGIIPNAAGAAIAGAADGDTPVGLGDGYWEITDPTEVGNDITTPTSVMGDDYQQTTGDNSYAADLRAAGESGDATARERQ